MEKGISPLIATVLLVAFTIALAGIALGFFNTFGRESVSESRNQGGKLLDCSAASIEIDDISVSSNDLIVNIRNTGSYEFIDLDLAVKDADNIITTYEINETLAKGVKTLIEDSESWSIDDVSEVTVNTECPGIFFTFVND